MAWGYQSTESLSNLSKITQLVIGRAKLSPRLLVPDPGLLTTMLSVHQSHVNFSNPQATLKISVFGVQFLSIKFPGPRVLWWSTSGPQAAAQTQQ